PAPRRCQRPLPARVALHFHSLAGDRRGESPTGFLLVEVARLQRQHVDLVPGRGQQRRDRGRVEAGALGHRDLAVGVADVVTEDALDEDVRRGRLPSLGNRFHARSFWLSGWPVVRVRTAWISARMARAISGALRAPRSSPIGTRTRARLASPTPSSRRNLRIVAPRRAEPSMPT